MIKWKLTTHLFDKYRKMYPRCLATSLQRFDERSQFLGWDKMAYGVDIWKGWNIFHTWEKKISQADTEYVVTIRSTIQIQFCNRISFLSYQLLLTSKAFSIYFWPPILVRVAQQSTMVPNSEPDFAQITKARLPFVRHSCTYSIGDLKRESCSIRSIPAGLNR